MTIRELEDKASQLLYDIRAYETPSRDISDLAIQFAIEVLEECLNKYTPEENIKAAIKQLKQYLDEKV